LVFPVLHGRQGEGGSMQAMLEARGIPYAGSGPVGSTVAMDKDIAKRLFRDAGITTPRWLLWPGSEQGIAALGLPLIVKPSNVGSTVGLTVVESLDKVDRAVRHAMQFDEDVLIEAFLPGREFTVGVLGSEALAVGEIIPSHSIFDYECKYTPGMTEEVFPADVPKELATELRSLALRAHRTLRLHDFSRADFRLAADGTPHCLEVNTLPGLTPTSLLPQSAAAVGIPFDELCHRICQLALGRWRSRNKAPAQGM
jgi:D-alanine-D-alanine ligase